MNEQEFEYLIGQGDEAVIRQFTRESQAAVVEALAVPLIAARVGELVARLDSSIEVYERNLPDAQTAIDALKPDREAAAKVYQDRRAEARAAAGDAKREEEAEAAQHAAFRDLERIDGRLAELQRDFERKRGRLLRMRNMRAYLKSRTFEAPQIETVRAGLRSILEPA